MYTALLGCLMAPGLDGMRFALVLFNLLVQRPLPIAGFQNDDYCFHAEESSTTFVCLRSSVPREPLLTRQQNRGLCGMPRHCRIVAMIAVAVTGPTPGIRPAFGKIVLARIFSIDLSERSIFSKLLQLLLQLCEQ